MAAPHDDPTPLARRWDAIVLGGGLAGAACAAHLVRSLPGTKVLVLTSEAQAPDAAMLCARGSSPRFLLENLGLEEEHELWTLPHHGARHWWADDPESRLEEMVEAGEDEPPRGPAFHLDAATLSECLVRRASAHGAVFETYRSLDRVQLELPHNRLVVELESGPLELQAGWLLDASGVLERPARSAELELHLASGLWSGLRPWSQFGGLTRGRSLRSLAEHNFHGRGWRAVLCPAPGGKHWLQMTLDAALSPHHTNEDGALRSREDYGRFVRSRPGLRELLRGARLEFEGFTHGTLEAAYPDPACGRGWVCIGEAAGSLAPFDGEPLEQLVRTCRLATALVGHGLPSRPASRAEEEGHSQGLAFRQRAARFGEGALRLGTDPTLLTAAVALDLGFRLAPLRSDASEALRAWIRARLVSLAAELDQRGLRQSTPSPRSRRTASACLPQLLHGAAAWARIEARCLRENFTPVPGDEHVSTTTLLQQYAASREVR